GIRDKLVTGVQTCALPIYEHHDVTKEQYLRERGHRLVRVRYPKHTARYRKQEIDKPPLQHHILDGPIAQTKYERSVLKRGQIAYRCLPDPCVRQTRTSPNLSLETGTGATYSGNVRVVRSVAARIVHR